MLTAPSQTHPSPKYDWLLLLTIVLVAAGLRLWRIDTLPPGLYFDEVYEGLEAWQIYSKPTYRPIFLKGDFGVVPLNAYANAVMFTLFLLWRRSRPHRHACDGGQLWHSGCDRARWSSVRIAKIG